MPIEISLPFDTDKIVSVIHYWLDLLANEDYAEAFSLTAQDPYYDWAPSSIEDCINGYGLPYEEGETIYKVTDWRKHMMTIQNIIRVLNYMTNQLVMIIATSK